MKQKMISLSYSGSHELMRLHVSLRCREMTHKQRPARNNRTVHTAIRSKFQKNNQQQQHQKSNSGDNSETTQQNKKL